MNIGPKWTGVPIDYTSNITYDTVNFSEEKGNILFASYFFMDNNIIYHEFTAFNVVDILSSIGGLFSVIASVFGVFALWINEKTIVAKYIRSLYFIGKPEELKRKLYAGSGDGGYQAINDIMIIKSRFYNSFWRKANSEQDKEIDQKELFCKGEEKVQEELCIFNILSTLQKLRAAVSVLVDRSDCKSCVNDILDLYYKNATIFFD